MTVIRTTMHVVLLLMFQSSLLGMSSATSSTTGSTQAITSTPEGSGDEPTYTTRASTPSQQLSTTPVSTPSQQLSTIQSPTTTPASTPAITISTPEGSGEESTYTTSTTDYTTSTDITTLITPTSNGTCPHECMVDCDCPDNACKLSDVGIGVGLFDPDGLASAGLTIDILLTAPRLTPGLPGPVGEALDNLINKLKSLRPVLYVKVEWVECVKSRCWLFSHEEECIIKKSEWIKVEIPFDFDPYSGLGYWPPVDEMHKYAEVIKEAIANTVEESCDGVGCQQTEKTSVSATSTTDISTTASEQVSSSPPLSTVSTPASAPLSPTTIIVSTPTETYSTGMSSTTSSTPAATSSTPEPTYSTPLASTLSQQLSTIPSPTTTPASTPSQQLSTIPSPTTIPVSTPSQQLSTTPSPTTTPPSIPAITSSTPKGSIYTTSTTDYTTSTEITPPNGTCPHECTDDCDCADNACKLSDVGIGVGLFDPDGLASAGLTIDILLKAPRLTPGLPSLVKDALNKLMLKLKKLRPVLYVKVEWVECVKSSCFVFWNEEECIVQRSKWIKVEIPVDFDPYSGLGYWPPVNEWHTHAGVIRGAVADTVEESCEGVGCQQTKAPASSPAITSSTPEGSTFTTSTTDYTTSTDITTPETPPPNGTCPHECTVDCDCPDNACKLSGVGIGVGLFDPDGLASAGLTIDILLLAPNLTPGLPGPVGEALDNLINKLKNARPVLYVKVEWVECVKSRCWLFSHEEECIIKISKWIKVEIPVDFDPYSGLGYWPPVNELHKYADVIKGAIADTVEESCDGVGCQQTERTSASATSTTGISTTANADETSTPPSSTIYASTLSPTPSHATSIPTTSSSTTLSIGTTTVEVVTTPAVVCDSNCGSLDQGGGTCKKSGGCTSCNLNKVLVKGRVANKYSGYCAKKVYCQAGSVILSAKAGRPCGCADSRCQYCIRTADTETCKKCNNGFYLLNDRCVETCPSTLTSSGIQNVGRKCLSPFTCKNNKEVEFGTKCKCAAIGNVGGANCHTCEFEAGQYGQKCTRCSENKFLNPNTHVCVDNCDGLDDVVSYQVGVYGAACRTPFTCMKGLDEAGEKCKCPKSIGGSKCVQCTWDIVDGETTATCLKP